MKKFKEVQRFTQWWIWLILIGLAAFVAYILIRQLNRGEMFGEYPSYVVGISLLGIVVLLLIIFISFFRMKTVINEDGISFEYFPFSNFDLKWEEIKEAKLVYYGKVYYGIGFNPEFGRMYNTRDRAGLFIITEEGDKYCIGTDKPEELQKTIENYIAKG